MNIHKLYVGLLVTLSAAYCHSIEIVHNSLDLSAHFTVSPKDGYPVFVTVYPYEGKATFNSSGKGKELCQGWLTTGTKISIDTHYDLLLSSPKDRGVKTTLSIEPGKGKEKEGCAGDLPSKYKALSCFVQNMLVDSIIVKFETKKVTKPTGNCNNGTADTKEVRLHAHYKQSDWDASYYSISFKVSDEEKLQDNENQAPSAPSLVQSSKQVPQQDAPSELSIHVAPVSIKPVTIKEPEPHVEDDVHEIEQPEVIQDEKEEDEEDEQDESADDKKKNRL